MPVNSLDLRKYNLILASKSPRRQALLKGLELEFEIRTKEVEESFSEDLKAEEIPRFLSQKKASAFVGDLQDDDILVTSDTVVWLGNRVFNKPENRDEAIDMISELSGRNHEVITAVCITSNKKQVLFHEVARVHFGTIERADIEWYVDKYQPFDKAGAYGIQEWIGYVGIDRIDGSFYNVMGFPTRLFFEELKKFIRE